MDTGDLKYKHIEVAVEEPKWPEDEQYSVPVSRRSTGGGKHLTQDHKAV